MFWLEMWRCFCTPSFQLDDTLLLPILRHEPQYLWIVLRGDYTNKHAFLYFYRKKYHHRVTVLERIGSVFSTLIIHPLARMTKGSWEALVAWNSFCTKPVTENILLFCFVFCSQGLLTMQKHPWCQVRFVLFCFSLLDVNVWLWVHAHAVLIGNIAECEDALKILERYKDDIVLKDVTKA